MAMHVQNENVPFFLGSLVFLSKLSGSGECVEDGMKVTHQGIVATSLTVQNSTKTRCWQGVSG